MYKDKTFLALIPARGGSKGVPRKNVKLLGEKPLIAWSIEAAQKSKYIDAVIVTTDDREITDVALQSNAKVISRPVELASDSAKMMDVIGHAVELLRKSMKTYDYLVLLQPTSPFRNENHIDEGIEHLFKKKARIVIGVTEAEYLPVHCNHLPEDGNMDNFYDPKFQKKNRQDFGKFYRLNGALYIAEIDFLLKAQRWFTPESYAYMMDRKSSVDINAPEDFWIAEAFLNASAVSR